MNATVARLTARSLLGRRRTLLLGLLPLALLALCVVARVLAGLDSGLGSGLDTRLAADLLGGFALAVMMPLLGLVAGTGSIGPEIDEGSIVYLLAKPLSRHAIVVTKLAVAVGVVVTFGVVPTLVAGTVLTGAVAGVTLAFGLGVVAAGVAYAAVFLLLAVVTRNAVVVGLVYALVWETLVGGLVPGAQALSVQQWSLALVERVLGGSASTLGVSAAVDFSTGLVLLIVVTVASTAYAGWRLQTLRLEGET